MRVDKLATRIERSAPRLYRALLGPWRYARQFLPIEDKYWAQRKHYEYYREVERLARSHVPEGGSVIDVGAGVTQLLYRFDWFERRVSLDRQERAQQRGIELITADFLAYQPSERFDLVLCLQVLEHLGDPAPFARKLLTLGRTVIISVPYNWPSGRQASHRQDPVDEAKLRSWSGTQPVETRIVRNGMERIIAVYRGSNSAPVRAA